MNVVLLHDNQAYFIKTAEVQANSGDQYHQLLKDIKAQLEEKGIFVCAVVGDNASGVQNGLHKYA